MPAVVGGTQFLAIVRLRYHFRPVKRPLADPRVLCGSLLGTWPSRDAWRSCHNLAVHVFRAGRRISPSGLLRWDVLQHHSQGTGYWARWPCNTVWLGGPSVFTFVVCSWLEASRRSHLHSREGDWGHWGFLKILPDTHCHHLLGKPFIFTFLNLRFLLHSWSRHTPCSLPPRPYRGHRGCDLWARRYMHIMQFFL